MVLRLIPLPLVLTTLLAMAMPIAARAEGGSPCEQTQAAIDLRSCGHCREVKRILSEPGLSAITFDVTGLRLGATVQIGAHDEEARLLALELVDQMWGESSHRMDEHTCEFCRSREEKLASMLVDWTSTDDGIQVVLISEDRTLAQWALKDARSTQGWVLSSASN
jgi:hypothetical protein